MTLILRRHLRDFGAGHDGKLFVMWMRGYEVRTAKPYANVVSPTTYNDIWREACAAALTKEQADSPLARRLCDVRHAYVSPWLNAGVPATQVAEWAVYAKCVYGQENAARLRSEAALRGSD